jgi:GNAT superfamily N-acetyltransferase
MEAYLDLVLVMNDAPRDDLEMNDFTLTEFEVRENEKQMEALKIEHWTLVARRKSDGAFAGFHDVSWLPFEPKFVHVGSTGVRPEHRGHALGKWLKAVMTLRVMNERPDVEEIRTGNADSNDAMLGINKQMGYRQKLGVTTWEVPTETAADWLKSRGIDIPERTKTR